LVLIFYDSLLKKLKTTTFFQSYKVFTVIYLIKCLIKPSRKLIDKFFKYKRSIKAKFFIDIIYAYKNIPITTICNNHICRHAEKLFLLDFSIWTFQLERVGTVGTLAGVETAKSMRGYSRQYHLRWLDFAGCRNGARSGVINGNATERVAGAL